MGSHIVYNILYTLVYFFSHIVYNSVNTIVKDSVYTVVNDMGSHRVNTFYIPRLCSAMA